jgi:hypothetical protein
MQKERPRHLSYANVAASLALFISLGGASYAAVSLAPHSVGSRELRNGAVETAALGFPLGAKGTTDESPQRLSKLDFCNAPGPPGVVGEVHCPLLRGLGGNWGSPSLSVSARRPGHLFVSATLGMADPGGTGTTATVSYGIAVDGRSVAQSTVVLVGGDHQQAPIQTLVAVPSGLHKLVVQAIARYSSYEPGEVVLTPISLVALTLP